MLRGPAQVVFTTAGALAALLSSILLFFLCFFLLFFFPLTTPIEQGGRQALAATLFVFPLFFEIL